MAPKVVVYSPFQRNHPADFLGRPGRTSWLTSSCSSASYLIKVPYSRALRRIQSAASTTNIHPPFCDRVPSCKCRFIVAASLGGVSLLQKRTMEDVPSNNPSEPRHDGLVFRFVSKSKFPALQSPQRNTRVHTNYQFVDDTASAITTSSYSGRVQGRPHRRPIPRKGHTKSRQGCFSCKRRRVKCPENLPTCDNCQRLGLWCEYPPQRDQVSEFMTLTAQQIHKSLSPIQMSQTDLHFFHHFLLHAYPGLPIQGEAVWREIAKYSQGVSRKLVAMHTRRDPLIPSSSTSSRMPCSRLELHTLAFAMAEITGRPPLLIASRRSTP